MKKLFAMLILLILAVGLLSACGRDSNEPATITTDDEEAYNYPDTTESPGDPAEYDEELPPGEEWQGAPVRGVWIDNTYVNEYLNIRFVKPHDWLVATDEEVAELAGIAVDAFFDMGEDFWEAVDVLLLVDMFATFPLTGSSVQVAFERLIFPMTRLSETEYIQRMITDLIAADMRAYQVPGTTIIGDYEWYLARSYMEAFGGEIIGNYFINIQDGFARSITIVHGDAVDPVNEILEKFSSLSAPAPPPLPTPPPPEPVDTALIGAWAWDLDNTYVYEFRPDGTGRGGFYPNLESFTWTTVQGDSHLMMHFGFAQDSWTYTIIDDVLTLDSRINIGESYSYIRWEGAFEEPEPVDFTGHALIGTWEWDTDASYIYTFHIDGTAVRGFEGDRVEILWYAYNEYLWMDTEQGVEEWVFTIEGDVLTIVSTQVTGMTWSYVRQG